MLDRRSALKATLLAAVATATHGRLARASNDWPTTTPQAAGFQADFGERIDEAQAAGDFGNLHAVVVARDGALVLERYYTGADERWGDPLGVIEFGPNQEHDLRSITKSVVALLYGQALAAGLVPGLDEPVVDFFPYPDLAADPQRRKITISNVLSMQMGIEWNENLPYTDPRNSEIAMEYAPDRYRYVLEQPMVDPPGTQWTYNGGATALLARLIAVGTGMPVDSFASGQLFAPLGIEHFEWVRSYDGEPSAASGLRLRPADLAKLGQLVLNGGQWEGDVVVPKSWLDQCLAERVDLGDGYFYGYQWWLHRTPQGEPEMAGFGNGGQRLHVVPSRALSVAILTGNYNQRGAGRQSSELFRRYILDAMV